MCSLYTVVFVRNIVILSVPVVVCAAFAVDIIPRKSFLFVALVAMSILPLKEDYRRARKRMRPDIRYAAEEWINENIPAGSTIAVEEYAPWPDESRFEVEYIGICGLAYFDADSARRAGLDYLVAASHRRFHARPEKYRREIHNYRSHVQEFQVAKKFVSGRRYRGTPIMILAVD